MFKKIMRKFYFFTFLIVSVLLNATPKTLAHLNEPDNAAVFFISDVSGARQVLLAQDKKSGYYDTPGGRREFKKKKKIKHSLLRTAIQESYEECAAFKNKKVFREKLVKAPFTDALGYRTRFFLANIPSNWAKEITKGWEKRLRKKGLLKKHAFTEKNKWINFPLYLLQGKVEDHLSKYIIFQIPGKGTIKMNQRSYNTLIKALKKNFI